MTAQKPPSTTLQAERHDPYRMRSIEWLLSLFDGGDFLREVMEGHKQLQIDLIEHKEQHGTKGCQGTMTITVGYALGKSGDVNMGAEVKFKAPKKPPSSATAFLGEDGELTLYSPMMARMQPTPRDATNYDPVTGEVRDID